MSVIRETVSVETARHIYDRLGVFHDVGEIYEGRAKHRALERLSPEPGQCALNVGVGTGQLHSRLQATVTPGGSAIAIDISRVMLDLTRRRTGAPVCEADAQALPFVSDVFDRLISTYVLDLIAYADLPLILREFRRVLVPGGRMVLVTMTNGVDLPSRLFVAAWEAVYRVSPIACGGCRPLELTELVRGAGFHDVQREIVVQLGVPSEVLTAVR